jgi:hypothetical protein
MQVTKYKDVAKLLVYSAVKCVRTRENVLLKMKKLLLIKDSWSAIQGK